ncbi:hypothetical protein ADK53_37135 [Streptomyces sp. WM6373]|uniref:hypothetical protein n=1 Tax=Streptomyces TaxID=1883 RepID=UPI0006AF87FF|nr:MULTISPECIES: hypothetical protein [unclassified Streptomyces]KOU27407.1 hypothetical protein ADK53_37135 [Streptomyces sp. WM6373]KOU89043.1 hypothetical protein ADK61_02070 [Streptomyces sp. XY66]KOV13234.1 hypothetical protein ADK90_38375 [Streptomyces sp. XY413]
MNHHTTRAILALTATLAALAIAAPAHAAEHPSGPTPHTAAPAQPVADALEAEDRGIIGMALDLLTGTPPEASPSAGGLLIPGYNPFGGYRPF